MLWEENLNVSALPASVLGGRAKNGRTNVGSAAEPDHGFIEPWHGTTKATTFFAAAAAAVTAFAVGGSAERRSGALGTSRDSENLVESLSSKSGEEAVATLDVSALCDDVAGQGGSESGDKATGEAAVPELRLGKGTDPEVDLAPGCVRARETDTSGASSDAPGTAPLVGPVVGRPPGVENAAGKSSPRRDVVVTSTEHVHGG